MKALRALALSALAFATPVLGQQRGLLYDPQPPANSAYVRVINATPEGSVDVSVDGRVRIHGLAGGEASDYLVLRAGKRNLDVGLAGKNAAVSVPVEIVAGRAMTVALNAVRADAKPWIFDDKANTNKLKAVLAVYHLDGKGAPVDVLTADGATKVFSGLHSGTSSNLSVNPVTVELIAVGAGNSAPLARVGLAMAPGGTYSVLLFPGEGGKLSARAMQNKVERYAGR